MKTPKNIIVPILVIFFWNKISVAQNTHINTEIGFSYFKAFKPNDYEPKNCYPKLDKFDFSDCGTPSSQNWVITQDSSGIIYVGNSSGLLWYNSSDWNFLHMPNQDVVRSIIYDNSTLFIGGQREFGFLVSDSLNVSEYKSLVENLPEGLKDFTDVWQINNYQKVTYFTTREGVYKLEDHSVDKLIDENIYKSYLAGNKLLVSKYDSVGGLFELEGDSLTSVDERKFFHKKYVSGFQKLNDGSYLLGTFRSGDLYKYDGQNFQVFQTEIKDSLELGLLSGIDTFSNGYLAFSTRYRGIFITNSRGDYIKTIDKSHGMLSNNVYDIYIDNEDNLWAAQDGGINKIQALSPITFFDNQPELQRRVTSIQRFQKELYIGTKEGLFKLKNEKHNSSYLEETSVEPINDLLESENELLVATNQNLYVYKGQILYSDKVFHLSKSKSVDNRIYAVAENRLLIIERGSDNRLIIQKTIYLDELRELSKLIEFNSDVLYVFSSTAAAVHRIELETGRQNITKIELKSSYGNKIQDISLINNDLYAGTDKGLHIFNSKINGFEKTDFLFDSIDKQVSFIELDKTGRIWTRFDKKNISATLKNNKYVLTTIPFTQINEYKLNEVYVEDNGITWFGTEKGLFHYDPTIQYQYKTGFKTNITGIYVENDSLIYGGFGEPNNPIVLPYKDNELRFSYAAASYIDESRNTYQYKLDGYDQNWSNWSLETQKDYTNLREGEYTFMVRSRNVYEVDGKVDTIRFSILPPWYRTWWAYSLYAIFFAGFLYLAYKVRLNQILKVHRVRNRIADDLHDDITGTLVGISNFANAAQITKDEESRKRFIDLIKENADDTKEKITDIVWAINPEHDDWKSFLAKCRRYASDMCESVNIEYDLAIVENIHTKLTMEIRQQLWMVYKELITNVIRHSDATHLKVILKETEGILVLNVTDNGSGFDSNSTVDGNGVRNIYKRSEKIKAKVQLLSNEQSGTQWEIKIPL